MSNPDRAAAVLQPNTKVDILSESTDLDSLMVAILGEEPQEKDERTQIVATIDAQVAEVIQELGLDKVLAERRRAAEAAARCANADVTSGSGSPKVSTTDSNASSASAPASDDSRPAPAPSSRLRNTIAKLFPLRNSVWLVAVLIGAATFATVNAIGNRNSSRDTRPAAETQGKDVFLPRAEAQSTVTVPAADSGTADAVAASQKSQAVTNRRAATRAVPPTPPVTLSRKQAAAPSDSPLASVAQDKPAAAAAAAKRSENSALSSTVGVDEHSAAPMMVDDSQPSVEPNPTTSPIVEPPLGVDTTVVPLPAIITERPMVSTVASPTGTANTTPNGVLRPARPLERITPVYPGPLRAARVGGTVGVAFTIDKTGVPRNVQARSGPPPLRAVAEVAVRQWRYAPATLNDVAVESEMTVQFTFEPKNSPRPE
jgi:TonB family protein